MTRALTNIGTAFLAVRVFLLSGTAITACLGGATAAKSMLFAQAPNTSQAERMARYRAEQRIAVFSQLLANDEKRIALDKEAGREPTIGRMPIARDVGLPASEELIIRIILLNLWPKLDAIYAESRTLPSGGTVDDQKRWTDDRMHREAELCEGAMSALKAQLGREDFSKLDAFLNATDVAYRDLSLPGSHDVPAASSSHPKAVIPSQAGPQ